MTILERLEKYRKINSETGCWEWRGMKTNKGYGSMGIRAKGSHVHKLVHRIAYEYYVGKIPENIFVCHHCDNPPCFNPIHLFLGTQSDNLQDALRKGRLPRGSNHRSSKLTEAKVREIRAKYKFRSYSYRRIATEYGVDPMTIFYIVSGKNWKHIL